MVHNLHDRPRHIRPLFNLVCRLLNMRSYILGGVEEQDLQTIRELNHRKVIEKGM